MFEFILKDPDEEIVLKIKADSYAELQRKLEPYEKEAQFTCPVCWGNGYVEDSDYGEFEDCAQCEGSGKVSLNNYLW